MDPFLTGVVLFSIVILIVCVWWLICNEITFRHKTKAILNAKNIEEIDMVCHVSYIKHLFYMVTFRNPKKLYNEQVRGYF